MTAADAKRRIGRKGAVLMILSAVTAGVGWSYIDPTAEAARAQNAMWREQFAPSWVWGCLWITVSVVCLVAALTSRDVIGFTSGVMVTLLWSGLELTGWVAGAISQGFRPALVWVGYSALIIAVAGLREPTRGAPPPPKGDGTP